MYSPTLESFTELAKQGNLIPVHPPPFFRRFRNTTFRLSLKSVGGARTESFLFESVEGGEHLGRYSFVGCNPRAIIRQTENRVELIEHGKVIEKNSPWSRRPAPIYLFSNGRQ